MFPNLNDLYLYVLNLLSRGDVGGRCWGKCKEERECECRRKDDIGVTCSMASACWMTCSSLQQFECLHGPPNWWAMHRWCLSSVLQWVLYNMHRPLLDKQLHTVWVCSQLVDWRTWPLSASVSALPPQPSLFSRPSPPPTPLHPNFFLTSLPFLFELLILAEYLLQWPSCFPVSALLWVCPLSCLLAYISIMGNSGTFHSYQKMFLLMQERRC